MPKLIRFVLCVPAAATLILWIASAVTTFDSHVQLNGANRLSIYFARQCVLLLHEHAATSAGTDWLTMKPDLGWYADDGLLSFRFEWHIPSTYPSAPGKDTYSVAVVPLWVPMVLFSVHPLISIRRAIRRHRRRARGLCVQCGYDLTGNTSGRCPECGEPAHKASVLQD